jgi:hypothetical protein
MTIAAASGRVTYLWRGFILRDVPRLGRLKRIESRTYDSTHLIDPETGQCFLSVTGRDLDVDQLRTIFATFEGDVDEISELWANHV